MSLEADYTVTEVSIDDLMPYWLDAEKYAFPWDCLFVSPMWLKSWSDAFGQSSDLKIYVVKHNKDTIGIAPLILKGKSVGLIGSGNVCDYLDFIIASGREVDFFSVLIDFLRNSGTTHLELSPLHRDATVFSYFVNIAESMGCRITFSKEDDLFELPLPGTWEAYLGRLSGKYRHEIRRKSGKLSKSGDIRFRAVDHAGNMDDEMGTFLSLFKSNRSDKSEFMTDQMASFFRSLAELLAFYGILKLYFLEHNDLPVAGVMCFDYHSKVYLYNNGYDSSYRNLSVGLLSKIFSIRDSIENGKKAFNFLKGNEPYKRQLGGREVPIYRCRITL